MLLGSPPGRSTAETKCLATIQEAETSIAWNHIFKLQRRGPSPKEDTKRAVALAHSRRCTKELISTLLSFGSMVTFEARGDKGKALVEKTAADVLPMSLLSGLLCVLWTVQHR